MLLKLRFQERKAQIFEVIRYEAGKIEALPVATAADAGASFRITQHELLTIRHSFTVTGDVRISVKGDKCQRKVWQWLSR